MSDASGIPRLQPWGEVNNNQGLTMDNEQTPLIERLHNEADQCRNDGADDIANLLGDCICEIRRLRAEVASEQKWGELWYFVSDDAPGEFERIVSEWTPSRWIGEAQKLMAEKR